jgi:hypothetical protein
LIADALKGGRTGWTVEVGQPTDAVALERVLHARRDHYSERTQDLAMDIIRGISAGRDPADLDDDLSTGDRLRRLFD